MGNFYSSFLEKCILPLGERVFGITYTKHLKKLRKVVKFSEEELIEYQNSKLEEMLSHSLKHSAYYKTLNIEFNTHDILGSLKKFPVMEKAVLRGQIDSILTIKKESLILRIKLSNYYQTFFSFSPNQLNNLVSSTSCNIIVCWSFASQL